MDTLCAKRRRLTHCSDPHYCSISNTHNDHNLANNIHGDSNTNVANVSNSYNTINVGVDEESLRIKSWLSPLEPEIRHRDVSNGRLDGVGDWVLQRNEFESWYGSQDGLGDPTLLCYGGQGVGKTFISSLVIDCLRKQANGENIAVLSLYCDYQAQNDQSAVNILGSLLGQIALGATQIPSEIRRSFELKQRGRQALRLLDMLELLVDVVSSIERVYICLDAIDELLPSNRSELLRALREIIRDTSNIRLFLTGRPHIREELDRYITEGAYIIHVVADQGDIVRYVSRKMEDDDGRDPGLMPDDLKHNILKTMMEKASEMFLLVALNIDAILGETSVGKRKLMLEKVATTGVNLENVYAQTLQRIQEQKGDRSRLGMEVLMWISHAERPLTIGELCYALAIEVGTTDLNLENICPQDVVLRSCLGLVEVDSGASTVRLIHYTLQEYLRLPDALPAAHQTLAQTCLCYLNYNHIKELPADEVPNFRDVPFLEYSSLYWGIRAKEGLSNCVKSLALKLLSHYDIHISAALLFNRVQPHHRHFVNIPLFTGLHCISYLGIVEVVEALIQTECYDINQQDSGGLTPLIWAIHGENEGVVRLLLTRDDVDPEKPDNHGQTPFGWASRGGHERLVRLMLARGDVNPNTPDNCGVTPLSKACWGGHEGVVRLLLARDDINPDDPDNNGSTPLMGASDMGHEGVVKLLLARDDVNPDEPDNDGSSPLWWAAISGHEGVVRLLLARDDVNPDRPNRDGDTPLLQACSFGYEGIVRLLLAAEYFNLSQPEGSGQRSLWRACINGDEEIVRHLLAGENVNADEPDSCGRTPLWWASLRGHEVVARLLLARDDVNPDKAGMEGRTPLLQASRNGHEVVVRLLLERGNVNPHIADHKGETPLLQASRGGNEGIVRLLLARGDINPDQPNSSGATPLLKASKYGHEGVVRQLLARDDVNPGTEDMWGYSPLLAASADGHEGIVGQLLARDDINPNQLNKLGHSPLWMACGSGQGGVVGSLLARDDIKPDQLECTGESPLWIACDAGCVEAVRLLLARDDVNPHRPNSRGQTPLLIASIRGHMEIVELLQVRIAAISSPE